MTPSAGEVTNFGSSMPSAADIYLINNARTAFIQLGWYLGSAPGLPYTATPRTFWGENVPGGEQLHAGPALSWDTVYKFTITPSGTTGIWDIRLQGNTIGQNNYTHTLHDPGFNGEVEWKCTRMEARARHASAPLRSLKFLAYGTWGYWSGTRYTTNSAFTSTNAGDIATNYSYGGG